MKRHSILLWSIVSISFWSCNSHQSVEKDFSTGAYSRGDGLAVKEITISRNAEKTSSNSFVFGDEISFQFVDVKGLKLVNGLVFPKMSLYVLSPDKDTLFNESDLMKNADNGLALDPLQLNAKFNAALPSTIKDPYALHVIIQDKKGNGSFRYEYPFTLAASDLLKIQNNGLQYEHIYLWNKSQEKTLANNHVKQDEELLLLFEAVKGLQEKDGRVHPNLMLDITDANGRQIMHNPNLFAKMTKEGIATENFTKNKIPIVITFDQGAISNPCKIKAELRDMLSDRTINVSGEIWVEK